MDKQIISFTANEQSLYRVGNLLRISSNPVAYVEAHFELGENWSGFDSIRAMFYNSTKCYGVILNNGVCVVPAEVIAERGDVTVNLVGSVVENDVLTDRLTTYPCLAIRVDAVSKICGQETAPVTPSQFEQFVSMVHDEVAVVTEMTAEAETLAEGSPATASYSNGVLSFGIPKGDKGDTGATGERGEKGDTGIGIPVGGSVGQFLVKAGVDDFDTEWTSAGTGVTDYTELTSKPQINSVELNGNKSLADLGIVIPTVPVQSVNSKTGNVVLNASDVNALPDTYTAPVASVNSKTGAVVLTASDVGALPNSTSIPTKTSDLTNDSGFLTSIPSEYVTDTEMASALLPKANTADLATVATSGSYNDLSNKPTIPTVPTNVSAFTNDAGYITSAPVSSVNGQTGAVVIGNATTASAGLMSAQDKTDLGTLMADYSSALTALGVI